MFCPVIFSYLAYGLHCVSNTPIPGFFPAPMASSSADLVLTITSLPPDWVCYARSQIARTHYVKSSRTDPADSAYTLIVFGSEDFFEVTYSDGTEFVVDGACTRLWAACRYPLTVDYLATYLRGPIMGFILRRRGVAALHASTVCIDGRAFVLCGESGTGKSTAAAAFALIGIPVMCDDITPLSTNGREFFVDPGYPQVGLWPDAVQSLLGSADALPRWTPSWEKCFLSLVGRNTKFEPQQRPCGAIYLLGPRSGETNTPRIEELTQRGAMLDLVQNTYMNWILNPKQRAEEFDFLSKLIAQVPVRRIVPHADSRRIGALCELIEKDAERPIGRLTSSVIPT
jgi:hypothetical protein